jgi:hypothetical protein
VPAGDGLLLWVTDRDTLIGVAPLYRRRTSLGPLPVLQRLLLVGGGRSTPLEIPPLLCAPGRGRAVTRALAETTLAQDVTWAEFCLSSEHGWLATQDLTTSSGAPAFSRYQQVRGCVVLPLRGTWEETRSGLKRNAKESVRRAVNRLAKDGRPWQPHHRTGADLGDDVVDRLLTLHRARSAYGGSPVRHADAFGDPAVQGFTRDVLPRLGRDRQASVVELELGGRTVAAQLVLHPPGGIFVHASGFLPEVWELSPVTALQVAAMQEAVARGEEWVTFSPGPNESKLRWSEHLALWNEVAVGPARRSALARYTAFSAARDARQLERERRRDTRAT